VRTASRVRVVADDPRAQPVRERELGARAQPLGEVVALAVVGDALDRHARQMSSSERRVVRARDLAAVAQAEHEVAEAEVSRRMRRSSVRAASVEPLSRNGAPTCARPRA
jgi:hypothetical protein